MALDELTEFFPVFIAHVHEFDAAAVGADVADHRSEIDFAETGADLQLDRVADSKSSRRLQISAAKADCFYARKARGCTLDLGTKRRVQWNSGVASRDNVTGARLPRRAESGRWRPLSVFIVLGITARPDWCTPTPKGSFGFS